MNELVAEFLQMWLLWWGVFLVTCAITLLAADVAVAAWQRRQRARRLRRAELERIYRDTAAGVQRIGSAFVLAQELIREEAANQRKGQR